MKPLTTLFIFCLPITIFAGQLHCLNSSYRFQGDQLLLSTQNNAQHLYLLNNKSAQAIYINHQKIPAGASAGWMSQLDPQQWSAIATKQKNFALTCTLVQPDNSIKQSCKDFLTVCFVPQAKFPQNLRNTGFWVTENKSAKEITIAVKQRRIKISN